MATDWVTISSLATAAGTLVLSVATFASVRSANRAARTAEEALLVGLRPLLMPSRLQDPPEKLGFLDGHWVSVPGGHGLADLDLDAEAVYLAMALRNVGSGMAVLHSWLFHSGRMQGSRDRPDPRQFRRLTRDLYVPAGDHGFWQGTFRDREDAGFTEAAEAITGKQAMTIDLLYGDHEGGQRVISRFSMTPHDDTWIVAVSRHWNLDRADPR